MTNDWRCKHLFIESTCLRSPASEKWITSEYTRLIKPRVCFTWDLEPWSLSRRVTERRSQVMPGTCCLHCLLGRNHLAQQINRRPAVATLKPPPPASSPGGSPCNKRADGDSDPALLSGAHMGPWLKQFLHWGGSPAGPPLDSSTTCGPSGSRGDAESFRALNSDLVASVFESHTLPGKGVGRGAWTWTASDRASPPPPLLWRYQRDPGALPGVGVKQDVWLRLFVSWWDYWHAEAADRSLRIDPSCCRCIPPLFSHLGSSKWGKDGLWWGAVWKWERECVSPLVPGVDCRHFFDSIDSVVYFFRAEESPAESASLAKHAYACMEFHSAFFHFALTYNSFLQINKRSKLGHTKRIKQVLRDLQTNDNGSMHWVHICAAADAVKSKIMTYCYVYILDMTLLCKENQVSPCVVIKGVFRGLCAFKKVSLLC